MPKYPVFILLLFSACTTCFFVGVALVWKVARREEVTLTTTIAAATSNITTTIAPTLPITAAPKKTKKTKKKKRNSANSPPPSSAYTPVAWKWEFPQEDSSLSTLNNSTSSLPPSPSGSTPSLSASAFNPSLRVSNINASSNDNLAIALPRGSKDTGWGRHKHFLACGVLIVGKELCAMYTSSVISPYWQLFSYYVCIPFSSILSPHSNSI